MLPRNEIVFGLARDGRRKRPLFGVAERRGGEEGSRVDAELEIALHDDALARDGDAFDLAADPEHSEVASGEQPRRQRDGSEQELAERCVVLFLARVATAQHEIADDSTVARENA